ncbi:hypothetical protein FACS189479_06080 [Spirochaetia bacterium]|nr:hypothetical protein FACS189479_06080 [Spirochaetia bacterium]
MLSIKKIVTYQQGNDNRLPVIYNKPDVEYHKHLGKYPGLSYGSYAAIQGILSKLGISTG